MGADNHTTHTRHRTELETQELASRCSTVDHVVVIRGSRKLWSRKYADNVLLTVKPGARAYPDQTNGDMANFRACTDIEGRIRSVSGTQELCSSYPDLQISRHAQSKCDRAVRQTRSS